MTDGVLDPRFFEKLGPVSLQSLAELAGARPASGAPLSMPVEGVAPLSAPRSGALTYIERLPPGPVPPLPQGAVFIIPPDAEERANEAGVAAIVSKYPRAAFGLAARGLFRLRPYTQSVEAIASDAEIGEGAQFGPGVCVGAKARIGRNARVGPGTVIGPGVTIGDNAVIGANCVIVCADIGNDLDMHSCSVIGESGFGVAQTDGAPVEMPHFGSVKIGNGLRLGAVCGIDRGMFGPTVIGDHCKLDNHCHIAHNVKMGNGVIMAAYAAVAGSTTVGNDVVFGGRVAVLDHATIGDGAVLAAGSDVLANVPAGETWGGAPAIPHKQHLKQIAWIRMKSGVKRRSSRRGKES